MKKSKLIYEGFEWNFELIDKAWREIQIVAKDVCPLDCYTPQIEVISSEQMLDAYSSVAMPVMYKHWSFGKTFIKNQEAYKKGRQGLAYEVVINTDPCLTYLMEDNSMTMQTLVMAHAAVGHSSFFKNNYLFKEWTDAAFILDYLKYAKSYIAECEQKYGAKAVEHVLDRAHVFRDYSVDKYKKPSPLTSDLARLKAKDRDKYEEETFNDLWRTTVKSPKGQEVQLDSNQFDYDVQLPEENILKFIEEQSPSLKKWIREILHIVRRISQYFYPQMQTQLMNEGWATFTHYNIMTELHNRGKITDGAYLEFIESHSGVIYQPEYDSKYYSGINVYALGFAMMQDIRRVCENPTEEDRKWFPDIAGTDWKTSMAEIIQNYRDESFVLQFLSPKVIREMKLFNLKDDGKTVLENPHFSTEVYTVTRTHDDDDVLAIRKSLANQYSLSHRLPQIEIVGYNQLESLVQLKYYKIQGRELEQRQLKIVMQCFADLFGPCDIKFITEEID